MQISEFVEETSRVEKYFNKEYTSAQRSEMFEQLKKYNKEKYRQIISAVLRRCRTLPKIIDFIDAANSIQETKETINFEGIEKCKKCKNSGLVNYKRIIQDGNNKAEYFYVARCDCQYGMQYSSEIPTISQLGLKIN